MRLFLDTEFNGFGGELISMALVPEEGTAWYEVCELPAVINPWVKEHVLPALRKPAIPLNVMRSLFHIYISQFESPDVYCDWHADAEHFCRLLEGNDYGSSLDFACSLHVLKTPKGVPISADPHNALADALGLKVWYLNGR